MRWRWLLVAAGAVVTHQVVNAQGGFNFKGLGIGDAPGKASGEVYHCAEVRSPTEKVMGDQTCFLKPGAKDTVAGAPVSMSMVYFYDNKLGSLRITFNSRDFADVAAAVTARYGAPAETANDSVTTRAGATFQNDSRTWKADGTQMHLKKYAGEINSSSLVIISDSYVAEFTRRNRDRAQESSKDFK